MEVLLHCLLLFSIIALGSDFAAMDGVMARRLSLPGTEIIPFIPFVGGAIYLVLVWATRNISKKWLRGIAILFSYWAAAIFTCIPVLMVNTFSQKIDIRSFARRSDFLPTEVIVSFQETFKTPVFQYSDSGRGPWLVVPRSRYSQQMVSFLRDHTQEQPDEQADAPQSNN